MKRLLFTLAFTLIIASVFCSCKEKTVIIKDFAGEINSTVKFEDSLIESEKTAGCILYGVNPSDVKECFIYVSSAATVDEFSVWEAKDSSTAKTIEEKIKSRIASQIEVYSTYKPEQVKKLDNALLKVEGRYVFYCVSEDIKTAGKVQDKYLG